MEVLTKVEYNNIKTLQRHYCGRQKNLNNNTSINKYANLSIRKKYDLARIIYDNLINGVYPTQEDCEMAEKILTELLSSITDEHLENCQIISEEHIDSLTENVDLDTFPIRLDDEHEM